MLDPKRIALAMVIVLVILIIARTVSKRTKDHIAGFWEASPDFASNAGIGEMFIYFAPESGGERDGHIFMSDMGGNTITNQGFTLRCKPSYWASLKSAVSGGARKLRAIFTFDEPDIADIMPDDMTLALSTVDGSMTLYDSEKIYAFLYRDNKLSAATD